MKRLVVIAFLAAFLAAAGSANAAQAGGITIDASLLFGTEPVGGYDSTIGIGVGALIDMSKNFNMSRQDMKMGIRGDLAYYDWDGDFYGVNLSYRRLMAFGGPRLTFTPGSAKIAPYVEGGLELAYDYVGVYVPGGGSATNTDLSIGLAGGGGVDFLLSPNMKLGINGRLHIISDSFLTLGVTLGFMF